MSLDINLPGDCYKSTVQSSSKHQDAIAPSLPHFSLLLIFARCAFIGSYRLFVLLLGSSRLPSPSPFAIIASSLCWFLLPLVFALIALCPASKHSDGVIRPRRGGPKFSFSRYPPDWTIIPPSLLHQVALSEQTKTRRWVLI